MQDTVLCLLINLQRNARSLCSMNNMHWSLIVAISILTFPYPTNSTEFRTVYRQRRSVLSARNIYDVDCDPIFGVNCLGGGKSRSELAIITEAQLARMRKELKDSMKCKKKAINIYLELGEAGLCGAAVAKFHKSISNLSNARNQFKTLLTVAGTETVKTLRQIYISLFENVNFFYVQIAAIRDVTTDQIYERTIMQCYYEHVPLITNTSGSSCFKLQNFTLLTMEIQFHFTGILRVVRSYGELKQNQIQKLDRAIQLLKLVTIEIITD